MKRPNKQPRRAWEAGVIRHAHHMLIAMIVLFVAAAILLGEMLDAYDAFWWWDDMLHGVSGIVFALIGLATLYGLNRQKELAVTSVFVGVFVFCFALAGGVLWEIYEFTIDVTRGGTMQQWNMGPNAVVMGRDFQGMGLRDTMSDLVLSTTGAALTAIAVAVAYSKRQPLVRRAMRWSFPLVSKK